MAREFKIPKLDVSVLPSVHVEAIRKKYDDMVKKIKEGKSPKEIFFEQKNIKFIPKKGGQNG